MEPSASSKVTVEYFDPSGLFPSLVPDLLPRLPLRNLHWKSPTRPIRSIDSLHIDLVPHGQQDSSRGPDNLGRSQRASTAGSTNSNDSVLDRPAVSDLPPVEPKTILDAGSGTFSGPLKERRHQIPGLRQTPYLRLYILRCDDNETYKSSSRKLLREWIKEHAPQSQVSTSKSDSHDAYEWLIIHAVLPGTAAAAQPRAPNTGSDTNINSTSQERPNSMRWSTKNTSTVLEKIRSDFNNSSKTAPDRVVQIRLMTKIDPANPSPHSPIISPDKDGEWADLMTRFKQLILRSFDTRVRQYEDDIKEREQQRALPGWNFCTFFILKEGLARGFESVGLLEDARVSYDELSVGLDTVVRESISSPASEAQAGAFLPYTENLRRDLEDARLSITEINSNTEAEMEGSGFQSANLGRNQQAINASKKRYRDLILSNNISVFDFRCYIFARQLSLLLRMANGLMRSSSSDGSTIQNNQGQTSAENLAVLANICKRSVEFISTTSRTLRDDLWSGYKFTSQQGKHDTSAEGFKSGTALIINNMVSSWMYSACQQILKETDTRALPKPLLRGEGRRTSSLKEALFSNGRHEQKSSVAEPKRLSQGSRLETLESLPSRSQTQSLVEQQSDVLTSRSREGPREQFLNAGLESLAASRATLYLLARSTITVSKVFRDAIKDVAELSHGNLTIRSSFEDVSLEADASSADEDEHMKSANKFQRAGISDIQLRQALVAPEQALRFYEDLSERALRHYTVTNRRISVQRITGDIAILKFIAKDYESAKTRFFAAIPFYSTSGWSQVDGPLLQAYAFCLKETGDKQAYIELVCDLLAKRIGSHKAVSASVSGLVDIVCEDYWSDLLEFEANADQEILLPLSSYFGNVLVDSFISHSNETDGFSLGIYIQHLLSSSFEAQKIRLKLISDDGGVENAIWLSSAIGAQISHGKTKIPVISNVVASGSFRSSRIEICLKNLIFFHDIENIGVYQNGRNASPVDVMAHTHTCFVFPRAGAAQVDIQWARSIHLSQSRSLLLTVKPGNNGVLKGQLLLKCASAGLRLHTPELVTKDESIVKRKSARPGFFEFLEAPSGSSFEVLVPYTLERDFPEVSVNAELTYDTPNGSFTLKSSANIPVILPLGVNVRDVFKNDKLFSSFNVSAATSVPIRILSFDLKSSETFVCRTGPGNNREMLVFPNQSACLVYEIQFKEGYKANDRKATGPLELNLHYQCLDDEVIAGFERIFSALLQSSEFKDLQMLLLPLWKTWLRKDLGSQKLERYGLLGTFELGSTSFVETVALKAAIPPARLKELEDWFKLWYARDSTLRRNETAQQSTATQSLRQITIPVDIPSVQVVHTVKLRFSDQSMLRSRPYIIAVGSVLNATLEVSSTRRWDLEGHGKDYPWPLPVGETGPELEFMLDVQASADMWLVGGSKKRHFVAREGVTQEFPLTLMALQAGHLLLPNVDVHPIRRRNSIGEAETEDEEADQSSSQRQLPTCEVDYKGHGEVILAVPDRSSATVGITSGSHAGAWLVDSNDGVLLT